MEIDKIIIYILCFLFLLISFFSMIGLRDTKQCITNPFVYGANKLETPATGKIFCVCDIESPRYASFYFNDEEVKSLIS